MGQKHNKLSLLEKQKKTCIAYGKYTAFVAPEYYHARNSPSASAWTSDSCSTGTAEGTTQLADDQINPLKIQEALPTKEVTEIQPTARKGLENREAQPTLEEIPKAGPDEHSPPYLDNLSLESKKKLPKEGVLQELEDPLMTPNELPFVQLAEDEAKIAKQIWNIDNLDSEAPITAELEEHLMSPNKERAIKIMRLTSAKCVQDSLSGNIEVCSQEEELGVLQETNKGAQIGTQCALYELKGNVDESTMAGQMNLQTLEDNSTTQLSAVSSPLASCNEPQADGMSML